MGPSSMGAAELLGPTGPFAAAMPGYQPRPGQMAMARVVERCLSSEGIALIEAGTGTGKTLAYLVPALLEAHRKKVVISTATRALQDQIFNKDLPLLERVLGTSLPVALMKGLPNYVCQRRYHEFIDGIDSFDPRFSKALPLVHDWLGSSTNGAIEELDTLAEDDPIWPRIAASSERRVGPACQYFESCFITRMKREAAAARIVVVNHHLFFADLALRGAHPASVLPDYDAVIFDEAHQLEDVATEHFGVSVSSARVARLCSDARPLLERELGAAAADHTLRIQAACDDFYDVIARVARPGEGRAALPAEAWAGAIESHWFALDTALEGLGARLHAVEMAREMEEAGAFHAAGGRAPLRSVAASTPGEALAALARRTLGVRDDLASIARGAPGSVTWFESSGRARKLSASPVDVAELFRTRLFDVVPSVVLTSATLSTPESKKVDKSGARSSKRARASGTARRDGAGRGEEGGAMDEPGAMDEAGDPGESGEVPHPTTTGPFRFHRQRLGLYDGLYAVDELQVPSPFRFEERALLYLPKDLPLPDDPAFGAAAAERCAELIAGCDGGAFVLTTSLRSMHGLFQSLAERVTGRAVLQQGQAPKAALIERFRLEGNAVLVATLSFWQGVDVPGSALRLVVLEKAPFPVPNDPIVAARSHALEQAGESPFARLFLPLAQLTLKQGFGRLIRSESDYGVVALLDGRVHARGYGRRLLEGLPPAPRVTEIERVNEFWAEQGSRAP
jgi:ATP-dependent DNA helicase DinG